jgi:hypothetical protein
VVDDIGRLPHHRRQTRGAICDDEADVFRTRARRTALDVADEQDTIDGAAVLELPQWSFWVDFVGDHDYEVGAPSSDLT